MVLLARLRALAARLRPARTQLQQLEMRADAAVRENDRLRRELELLRDQVSSYNQLGRTGLLRPTAVVLLRVLVNAHPMRITARHLGTLLGLEEAIVRGHLEQLIDLGFAFARHDTGGHGLSYGVEPAGRRHLIENRLL
jgi:hypothetical protein